ncbi:hypothetical protein [Nonomuraea typhae]|uniref:hypothetical protein n=1 Tax=Nonomuraea typhae TaxID=2603600 RepID=UPI0015E23926|nr:hypothetical protein [Nonomuraea typhae]
MKSTLVKAGLAAVLLAGATAAAATPSAAATAGAAVALRPVNVDCGWVTCSLYFSRSLTKRMTTPYEAAASLSGLCPHIACKAFGAAAGVLAFKAKEAAGKNQCLRVRYERFTYKVVGLYSDGSRHCHDS